MRYVGPHTLTVLHRVNMSSEAYRKIKEGPPPMKLLVQLPHVLRKRGAGGDEWGRQQGLQR